MSYNLNPTDKVIQIAKEVIDSFDKIRPKGAGRNTEMPFDDFALICNAKNNLRQALTAYEKSKEERPHEKVLQAFRELDRSINQLPTQEPESKEREMDFDLEIEGTAEILMGSDSLPANVIILSRLINRATKDLTDEVERLRARIEELEKQNNELKNIDDCPHENVDMKYLRCTICLECGKIIDVID